MEVRIRYKHKSKGDGADGHGHGASKSGASNSELADKDRVWMRLYQLTEEQLQELKDAFDECDHANTGFIRAHDLGTALRITGQIPTESDIQEMLQDATLDDTGSLSLEEYIRLVGNFGMKSGPEIEQEFEDALRFFDKDGRGVIEAEQLKAALQTCGEPLEDDDIVELLKAADLKGDGKIDYLEFVRKLTTTK